MIIDNETCPNCEGALVGWELKDLVRSDAILTVLVYNCIECDHVWGEQAGGCGDE